MEKGKAILMKDNMIDPEKAKLEEAGLLTTEQKILQLGQSYLVQG